MKKVAVDLRILDTPSGKRGTGYFTFNQFQSVEELLHQDLEIIYYSTWKGKHSRDLKLKSSSKFYDIPSAHRPARGIRRLDPVFGKFWHQAIKKSNPDIIHITHLFETNYVDIPKDIPSVVTFYDLIPYFNLEKYFSSEKAMKWYRNRLNQLNYASRIIAISQSVKEDLVKQLGIPAQKIKVIYGGFDRRFKVIDKTEGKTKINERYGINKRFILSQPAFSPHKNVDRIFLSFKKFIENSKNDVDLVVVCKLIPKEEEVWDKRLKVLGIRERVHLTNFVSDQELPLFYNAAEVLLFPSLYEGFGLPILEAMACGCPVITSNVSSMPEAGGDAPFYVNPQSVDEITKSLEKVLSDQKLREQMVKKGFNQIKKFSWEKCARETLEIYYELLSSFDKLNISHPKSGG